MGSDAVCEAMFGKLRMMSESPPRGGVSTKTLCGNLGSVWEAAIDVGIAASGRCDDEDALRQPRRGRSPCALVFRVGSQVGCGGVPNVVVFHDDIDAFVRIFGWFPCK